MLARILAMALCLSVSVSVTSRCSIEVVSRIELVFGTGASFDRYTVFYGNSGMYKNKGILPITPWHIDPRTCYQLSSRKVDAHSVINWTVVGQLS